ncbi:hypothetical protein Tco_0548180 [Tanacetum coccineum]
MELMNMTQLYDIDPMIDDLKVLARSISLWKSRPADGVLRHPADSQAWRTIDEKFPEIAKDPKNLRLGISADGVDVNIGNRHHMLERLGGRGAAVDCLDHLRLIQKSDPKKHVSLSRILLEARVKTHERQLVVALWI